MEKTQGVNFEVQTYKRMYMYVYIYMFVAQAHVQAHMSTQQVYR